MGQELPFEPFSLFADPHKQTIINSLCNFLWDPPSETKLVPLPDGDKIALELTTPWNWKPDNLTVLLVHGWNGRAADPSSWTKSTAALQRKAAAIRASMPFQRSGSSAAA